MNETSEVETEGVDGDDCGQYPVNSNYSTELCQSNTNICCAGYHCANECYLISYKNISVLLIKLKRYKHVSPTEFFLLDLKIQNLCSFSCQCNINTINCYCL